jgi:Fur family transcriptional regulator, ferric uptake regulator
MGRLEQLCKERGLRLVAKRRIVVMILDGLPSNPTADDIYRETFKDRKLSLPTIYRTLNMLMDHDLLQRVDLGDKKVHFAKTIGSTQDHGTTPYRSAL